MGARRGEAALACFRLPTALLHGLHRARSEDLGYGPCNQFVSRLAGLKSILTDDLRRDSQQNPGLQAGVVQNHELVGEGDCCSEIGERLSISSADDCLRYVVTALRDALLHSLHVSSTVARTTKTTPISYPASLARRMTPIGWLPLNVVS